MTPDQIEAIKEAAKEFHYWEPNCNCAQSVACSLCDLSGVSKDQAFRAMEGFGGGMGGFTQTCGAVSGAIYSLSVANSAGIEERTSKDAVYEMSAQFVAEFKEEFGSTLCSDLRSDNVEKRKSICDGYIQFAAAKAAERLS